MIGGGIKSGDMSNIVRTQGDNNVTIVNNIDESLVTRLIKSMIADNLPDLRNEAKRQVEDSVDEYIKDIISEMAIQRTDIETLQEKLSSPDIQYSLFETSKSFAKNPKRAEKSTLINLVVKKINEFDSDDEELTSIDMAINAATKLSVRQIRFISLLYYIINIVKVGVDSNGVNHIIDPSDEKTTIENNVFDFGGKSKRDVSEVYDLYIKLYTDDMQLVFKDGDVGRIDYSIPISLGCLMINPLMSNDFINIIKKRTNIDLSSTLDDNRLRKMKEIIELATDINSVDHMSLTKVGMDIANAYISTRMRLVKV